MHGLISVKKAELDAEVRKYERAKAKRKRKEKSDALAPVAS
jgi:hypothetical protein